MSAIFIYNGYSLYPWGCGYKSEIGGRWIEFDSAAQWKKYIDDYGRKENHRN